MKATTSPLDRSRVAQSWQERGFSCELWVDGAGQVWADFVHATDELVMVVEGAVEFEFGGKVFRPEQGHELIIPAGARHTVRNVGGTRSEWLYGYRRAPR
jgi:mannose-6-phosphate isomerase-like protein (cupin superfamily)